MNIIWETWCNCTMTQQRWIFLIMYQIMSLFCDNGKHAPSLRTQKNSISELSTCFTRHDFPSNSHIHAQVRKHLPQQRQQPAPPRPISLTNLHDHTLFDLILFAKQYASQITYIYHGQRVAVNTMALFFNTGLDQLGPDFNVSACIKRHENTLTNIYGQGDSKVLINNREKDQIKIIYIHSGEAGHLNTCHQTDEESVNLFSEVERQRKIVLASRKSIGYKQSSSQCYSCFVCFGQMVVNDAIKKVNRDQFDRS